MNKAHLLTEKLALEKEYNKGKISQEEFMQRMEDIQQQLQASNFDSLQ